ncbi:hypothetical protein Tco_0636984 [Tanacetum coccineum]
MGLSFNMRFLFTYEVRLEALDIAQKAKIKWAIEGEENTKIFHGSLKTKRRQLAIKDGVFDRYLSSNQSDFLERDFSQEEIKRAVWDCGGDRAPGPDGFSFKFVTPPKSITQRNTTWGATS